MKGESENIDSLFKRDLKDFSPDVPEGIWENIAMNLANKGKSKKVPLFFWKAAASIALLVGTTILGTYLFFTKPADIQVSGHKNNETEAQKITSVNTVEPVSSHEKTKNTNEQGTNEQNITNLNTTTEKRKDIKPGVKTIDLIAGNHKNTTSTTVENSVDQEINPNSGFTNNVLTEQEEPVSDDILPEKINTLTESGLEKGNNQPENQNVAVENEDKNNNLHNLIWEDEGASITALKKERQWSIGGQAGPQYTYRTLSSDVNAQELLDMSDRDESGTIAYAAGIHIEYKPARRFSVQSGVYYSKYSFQGPVSINMQSNNFDYLNPSSKIDMVKTDELIIRFPNSSVEIGKVNTATVDESNDVYNTPANVHANSLMEASDVPVNTVSTRNYEYIEIPIIARYAIIDRKLNLEVLGGVSTNILVDNNIEIKFPVDLPDEYESKDINTINYSSTIGFGVGYDITKNISFSLEPQFKYFLGSLSYSNNDVRPYSLGIYSGIKYLF